jgi:putative hydrolase of HD superfamily
MRNRKEKNSQKNWNDFFHFLALVDNLKRTYRYSQCQSKKFKPDSAADHTWRLALMVFTLAQQLRLKINLARALKIAIIHDINEAIIGDIDYVLISQGKAKVEVKDKKERRAMKKICQYLSPAMAKEIKDLWQDYCQPHSAEAKFTKALDKLETMIYLIEAGYLIYCQPRIIPNYADKAVANFPLLKPLLREVKIRLKREYLKGRIPWKKEYD